MVGPGLRALAAGLTRSRAGYAAAVYLSVVHRSPRSGVSPLRTLVSRRKSVAIEVGTGCARVGRWSYAPARRTRLKATRTVCLRSGRPPNPIRAAGSPRLPVSHASPTPRQVQRPYTSSPTLSYSLTVRSRRQCSADLQSLPTLPRLETVCRNKPRRQPVVLGGRDGPGALFRRRSLPHVVQMEPGLRRGDRARSGSSSTTTCTPCTPSPRATRAEVAMGMADGGHRAHQPPLDPEGDERAVPGQGHHLAAGARPSSTRRISTPITEGTELVVPVSRHRPRRHRGGARRHHLRG